MPKIAALPTSSGVAQENLLAIVSNTAIPLVTRQASVDQVAAIAYTTNTSLVNGANNNVNFAGLTNPRAVKLQAGPSAAFSITGIAASTINGRQLSIWNDTGQSLTIGNESGSSTAANRIITLTGTDLVFFGAGVINLAYDTGAARWVVVSCQNPPLPYKSYVALLNQSGTADPVATVLENTVGNVVWSRAGVGDYLATLTGAFPVGKVVMWATSFAIVTTIQAIGFLPANDGNNLSLQSFDVVLAAPVDDLTDISVQFRVYP